MPILHVCDKYETVWVISLMWGIVSYAAEPSLYRLEIAKVRKHIIIHNPHWNWSNSKKEEDRLKSASDKWMKKIVRIDIS